MTPEVKKAFIVGVDHRIQYTNSACGPEWLLDIRRFEDYLVEQATKLDVDVLAEESSKEALRKSNATSCTVCDAAKHAARPHLFLDPDSVERRIGGISTDDRREGEWLRRLRAAGSRRPLVVCGDDHVSSFEALLTANHYVTEILSCNWGNNWMWRN